MDFIFKKMQSLLYHYKARMSGFGGFFPNFINGFCDMTNAFEQMIDFTSSS